MRPPGWRFFRHPHSRKLEFYLFIFFGLGVTKTANHLKPSKIILNQKKTIRNYPETTHNYLHERKPLATPPRNKPPNFFFCSWLWAWFNNQESRIRKKWRKSSGDDESQEQIVNPVWAILSRNSGTLLSNKSYVQQYVWMRFHKGIKSFIICFC